MASLSDILSEAIREMEPRQQRQFMDLLSEQLPTIIRSIADQAKGRPLEIRENAMEPARKRADRKSEK